MLGAIRVIDKLHQAEIQGREMLHVDRSEVQLFGIFPQHLAPLIARARAGAHERCPSIPEWVSAGVVKAQFVAKYPIHFHEVRRVKRSLQEAGTNHMPDR